MFIIISCYKTVHSVEREKIELTSMLCLPHITVWNFIPKLFRLIPNSILKFFGMVCFSFDGWYIWFYAIHFKIQFWYIVSHWWVHRLVPITNNSKYMNIFCKYRLGLDAYIPLNSKWQTPKKKLKSCRILIMSNSH